MAKMKVNIGTPASPAWITLDANNADKLGGKDASSYTQISDYVRSPAYVVTAGSANVYTATLVPACTALNGGVALAVNINVTNTGASTINVDGLGAKAIVDSKGNPMIAGKLKAGCVYTLRYNGTAFQLQGEGGDYGTAGAPDVLAGKTIGTDAGIVVGTMVNNGTKVYTPSSGNVSIDNGYHVGSVVSGDPEFIAANFRADKNMFGLQGSMPVMIGGRPLSNDVGYYEAGGSIFAKLPDNTYLTGDNNFLKMTDPDFIAANILNTTNIFGLQGSAVGRKFYSFTIVLDYSVYGANQTVALPFVPVVVFIRTDSGTAFSMRGYTPQSAVISSNSAPTGLDSDQMVYNLSANMLIATLPNAASVTFNNPNNNLIFASAFAFG